MTTPPTPKRRTGEHDLADLLRKLTPREAQALAHLSAGHDLTHVATALGVTPATARSYIHRAMRKLGAPTPAAAVALAHPDGAAKGGDGRTAAGGPPQPGDAVTDRSAQPGGANSGGTNSGGRQPKAPTADPRRSATAAPRHGEQADDRGRKSPGEPSATAEPRGGRPVDAAAKRGGGVPSAARPGDGVSVAGAAPGGGVRGAAAKPSDGLPSAPSADGGDGAFEVLYEGAYTRLVQQVFLLTTCRHRAVHCVRL
ncbi:response regulator transcription factor, partial [Streptomyces sp. NRRL WC-3742]|uniref:response regulator transcription factor n=1 Tax=Streptomyces sp. NRRL WC-3742 TaxID=1463934 RepID=UPI0004CBA5B9